MKCTGNPRRLRRLLVISLYVMAAASGLCQGLRPGNGLLHLFFVVAMASAATLWCVVDARILGRPILTSLQWIIFWTWPLAVPGYLIWARKARGLVLAVVHAVGLYLVYGVLFIVPAYTAYSWAYQGCVALEDRDYDRAVSLLGRAVALRTDDAASWHNLGLACEASGDRSAGIAALEKACSLDPTYEDSRDRLNAIRRKADQSSGRK